MMDTIQTILRIGDELVDLATEQLKGVTEPARLASATARIVARAEEILSERPDGAGSPLIACAPGCMTCCTVNVSVLAPEAWTIAHWLQKRHSDAEMEKLAERLTASARTIRWLDDADRIRGGVTCPFLDDRGWCSIHPVRPLMCRSVTSTDPELCRRALDSRTSDEEVPLVCDLFQKFLMEQTYRALATALEWRGLDGDGRELVGAVSRFLSEPELAGDYLAGSPVRPLD